MLLPDGTTILTILLAKRLHALKDGLAVARTAGEKVMGPNAEIFPRCSIGIVHDEHVMENTLPNVRLLKSTTSRVVFTGQMQSPTSRDSPIA